MQAILSYITYCASQLRVKMWMSTAINKIPSYVQITTIRFCYQQDLTNQQVASILCTLAQIILPQRSSSDSVFQFLSADATNEHSTAKKVTIRSLLRTITSVCPSSMGKKAPNPSFFKHFEVLSCRFQKMLLLSVVTFKDKSLAVGYVIKHFKVILICLGAGALKQQDSRHAERICPTDIQLIWDF